MYVKAWIKVSNGEKTFGDLALADTGATGIIIDESIAEELAKDLW
ncbi:MAG: hypothetical protein ACUVTM_06275 [Candidatus Bathyarchaeia archaeon]